MPTSSLTRPTIGPAAAPDDMPPPRRFVEVTVAGAPTDGAAGTDAALAPPSATGIAPAEPGWSLWGDAEP